MADAGEIFIGDVDVHQLDPPASSAGQKDSVSTESIAVSSQFGER